MTSKHDAARAALEAALAATSSPSSPSSASSRSSSPRGRRAGGGRPRPEAWQPIPADPEADPTTRDEEPDAYDVARQIVLRQLALSPRSRKQLRDKLRERHCPDDVAEAVLDRMGEVGLVDDEAYAGMLVRSQQASRGLARRALARELRTKGVDDETARATLETIDPAAEREQAERLV